MTRLCKEVYLQASSIEADKCFSKLSSSTLDALKDFYSEKDAHTKRFADLKINAENDFDETKLSIDLFAEDWNVSQFWVRPPEILSA